MRILLVNYRYFVSGGPEKYMFNVKKLLEDHGHEVFPFSVSSNKNEPTNYAKYFVEPIGSRDAVYFDEVRKTPRAVWQMLSRSVYSLEVKKAIQKEIADLKPDIVYIIHFVNKLSPSVITGAKQMGVPVVLRLSDYFLLCPRFDFIYERHPCEDCLRKGYRTCVKRRCVKGSLFASAVRVLSMKIHKFMDVYDGVDAFVTPSGFLKDKLVANGYDEERIRHIPTFAAGRIKTSGANVGTYGLYFGRISVEKGVETAISAYEKLPGHKLVITGDDTSAEAVRLKEYVRERRIQNVEFTGFKSGEELEEVIRDARFALIPSVWYDNLPNVALEAFRFSKPVIASDIGSLPELVEDGINGLLFTPGDSLDLAKKIEELDDDGLVMRLGEAAGSRLEESFSPEAHYQTLMALFNEVMRDRTGEGKYRRVENKL